MTNQHAVPAFLSENALWGRKREAENQETTIHYISMTYKIKHHKILHFILSLLPPVCENAIDSHEEG